MSTRRALPALSLAFFLGSLAALPACGGAAPATAVAADGKTAPAPGPVDGATAKKLVAGGARLIDVRGADEFGAKHIEGAENAPVETIEDRDLGAKDASLVLYCGSGKRAARAAATLRAKGYTHVYELGAMSSWDK